RRKITELEGEIERWRRENATAEDRFKHLADASPVMIWISGPDALITYFNRPWLEFRGRRMEEESGNGWMDGVHPDDRDRCVESYLKSCTSRQHVRIQDRLRRADGEYGWVENRGVPFYNGEGTLGGFTGSAVDVNQRQHGYYTPDEESVRLVFSLTERERE